MSLLWIPATLVAAAAQTARNAAQKSLVATIGTVGATQVRFLYGLPFVLAFLALQCVWLSQWPPLIDAGTLAHALLGALSQITATVLMLTAMKSRSFSVTTACVKTEPVWVALLGLALLGDVLTPLRGLGILIATTGVVVMALMPGSLRAMARESRPLLLGVAAGAIFAVASVAFRGAILALAEGGFLMRATTILALTLVIQAVVLVVYMLVADRAALTGSLRVWRASFGTGFLGALASQGWFIGFALTSAANVKTLGLVEVFFAQFVARRHFAQPTTRREYLGMVLVVIGVLLVLLAA